MRQKKKPTCPMTDKSHHLKRSQDQFQYVGCAAPCADYSLILVLTCGMSPQESSSFFPDCTG